MAGITENRLLAWSLIVFLVYWAVGLLIPGQIMATSTSFFLLVAGVITFARYGPDAYAIVVRGRRNVASEDGDGSHLAAYGVALLAAGSCYIGLFGLTWTYWGQPTTWLGTAFSGFGRALMTAGFVLLSFSPEVYRRRVRLPLKAWLIALIAAALLAAFMLGAKLGPPNMIGLSYRAAASEPMPRPSEYAPRP